MGGKSPKAPIPSPSMPKAQTLTTTSLDALQNADQRQVMDLVDDLRRNGLSGILQLPQLVVCGDQSSGKSSVLEAITEIPFPRKENLCTRFATEIVLRRGPTDSILTTITPDEDKPAEEKRRLEDFGRTIDDFSELPGLIDEATALMGLGISDLPGATKAFSKDVLRLEIRGPGRTQLTLVDLPGLIHAENKSQTKDDIKLIHDLVHSYISRSLTIVLAVVSAKNDYANQIILNKCKEVDADGSRTLGIITKPDFLRAGSDNERSWMDLANNKDIQFKLGWHMLRNRADDEAIFTFAKRNMEEATFFGLGNYAAMPRNMLGIDSLRLRLSRLLNDHLKMELPGLKRELTEKLNETNRQLSHFGEKCSTPQEQRAHLIKISMAVHDILKMGVSGQYENRFFGSVDTGTAIDAPENAKRLRAVVQHLNLQFASRMIRIGHKFTIKEGNISLQADSDWDIDGVRNAFGAMNGLKLSEDPLIPDPVVMARSEAIDWVLQILKRSRGRELPGDYNPLLASQLFWEQSEKWEAIAMEHIRTVAARCEEYVYMALTSIAKPQISSRMSALYVEGSLASTLKDALAELQKVIDDKSRQPITYNHYYSTTIQKMRRSRHQALLERTLKNSYTAQLQQDGTETKNFDSEKFHAGLETTMEKDMDKFSAEDTLDRLLAYYKSAVKYFIDVVATQIIERHLVYPLSEDVISPKTIGRLTDGDINYVVAEPENVAQERAFLESRKQMLESGQETFRRVLSGFR